MSDTAQYKKLYKKYKAKCADLKSKMCALEQELDGIYNGYGRNECLTTYANEGAGGDMVEKVFHDYKFLAKEVLFSHLHTRQAIITVQKDQASSCDVRQGFQPAST